MRDPRVERQRNEPVPGHMFRRVAGNCHIRFLWLIRPFLLVRFRRARELRQTTPLGNPDTLKSFAHSLLPTREDARCGKRMRADELKIPLGLSPQSWQDSPLPQDRLKLLRNQIVQTAPRSALSVSYVTPRGGECFRSARTLRI